eukprot:gene2898-4958_t
MGTVEQSLEEIAACIAGSNPHVGLVAGKCDSGKPCPAGYFCPNSSSLIACPQGYFCPPSSMFPVTCSLGSLLEQIPTASLSPSLSLIVQQLEASGIPVGGNLCPPLSKDPFMGCPGGFFCPTPSAAIQCPVGHYCPERCTSPVTCSFLLHCSHSGTRSLDHTPSVLLHCFHSGTRVPNVEWWSFLALASLVIVILYAVWRYRVSEQMNKAGSLDEEDLNQFLSSIGLKKAGRLDEEDLNQFLSSIGLKKVIGRGASKIEGAASRGGALDADSTRLETPASRRMSKAGDEPSARFSSTPGMNHSPAKITPIDLAIPREAVSLIGQPTEGLAVLLSSSTDISLPSGRLAVLLNSSTDISLPSGRLAVLLNRQDTLGAEAKAILEGGGALVTNPPHALDEQTHEKERENAPLLSPHSTPRPGAGCGVEQEDSLASISVAELLKSCVSPKFSLEFNGLNVTLNKGADRVQGVKVDAEERGRTWGADEGSRRRQHSGEAGRGEPHGGRSQRCPRSFSAAARNGVVERVMATLGLTHIENNVVNNVATGISSDQRNLVSIGIELVSLPSVLLVDSGTSSRCWDAHANTALLPSFRELTRETGLCMAMVIDQPRYSMLETFDTVLLLAQGRPTYLGPTSLALDYFRELGFTPPELSDPVDFFLDVISGLVSRPGDEDFKTSEIFDLWGGFGQNWVQAQDRGSDEGLPGARAGRDESLGKVGQQRQQQGQGQQGQGQQSYCALADQRSLGGGSCVEAALAELRKRPVNRRHQDLSRPYCPDDDAADWEGNALQTMESMSLYSNVQAMDSMSLYSNAQELVSEVANFFSSLPMLVERELKGIPDDDEGEEHNDPMPSINPMHTSAKDPVASRGQDDPMPSTNPMRTNAMGPVPRNTPSPASLPAREEGQRGDLDYVRAEIHAAGDVSAGPSDSYGSRSPFTNAATWISLGGAPASTSKFTPPPPGITLASNVVGSAAKLPWRPRDLQAICDKFDHMDTDGSGDLRDLSLQDFIAYWGDLAAGRSTHQTSIFVKESYVDFINYFMVKGGQRIDRSEFMALIKAKLLVAELGTLLDGTPLISEGQGGGKGSALDMRQGSAQRRVLDGVMKRLYRSQEVAGPGQGSTSMGGFSVRPPPMYRSQDLPGPGQGSTSMGGFTVQPPPMYRPEHHPEAYTPPQCNPEGIDLNMMDDTASLLPLHGESREQGRNNVQSHALHTSPGYTGIPLLYHLYKDAVKSARPAHMPRAQQTMPVPLYNSGPSVNSVPPACARDRSPERAALPSHLMPPGAAYNVHYPATREQRNNSNSHLYQLNPLYTMYSIPAVSIFNGARKVQALPSHSGPEQGGHAKAQAVQQHIDPAGEHQEPLWIIVDR